MSSGGRFPCHHYVAYEFGSGDLGFVAVPLDPNLHPLLGNVIVLEVKPGGQADGGGILPMDALICINNEYVAFLSAQACFSKLATMASSRPLRLQFARPLKSMWQRIGNNEEEIIKQGEVEKQARFLRWQVREFFLTRSQLYYAEEGVVKKYMPLEEVTRVVPNDVNKKEFSFFFQQREVNLRVQTEEDCIAWLHAIESTKRGCFENVLSVLSRVERAQKPLFPSNKPTTATVASATTITSLPIPPPPPPPSFEPITPYHLLNRSVALIRQPSSTSTTTKTPTKQSLNSVSMLDFPVINLSLENQLIQQHGGQ